MTTKKQKRINAEIKREHFFEELRRTNMVALQTELERRAKRQAEAEERATMRLDGASDPIEGRLNIDHLPEKKG